VADEEEELRQSVRKAMAGVLAEARPMPVPATVTEVIVRPGLEVILRVGPAHALRTLHREGGRMPCSSYCGDCGDCGDAAGFSASNATSGFRAAGGCGGSGGGGCGGSHECGESGSSSGPLAFAAQEEGLLHQLSERLQVPREQLLNDLLARALGVEIRRRATEEGIEPEPKGADDS
jgi:hypothetical protein